MEIAAKSIRELKAHFLGYNTCIPERFLNALEKDPRAGAKALALTLRRRDLRIQSEGLRLQKLLRHEIELRSQGFRLIAGVDEAGMAPLAGPVVAAAVILPSDYMLQGLDDSKKILDERKREKLAAQIKRDAVSWAVGQAQVEEIERINIYQAGLLAMHRAISQLTPQPDYLLVDARTVPRCCCPQRAIIHGDALSASIAAASLIAKTTRDLHMMQMDEIYPEYGFAKHKGYPTAFHLMALRKLGPSPIHRKTFGPVKALLSPPPRQQDLFT